MPFNELSTTSGTAFRGHFVRNLPKMVGLSIYSGVTMKLKFQAIRAFLVFALGVAISIGVPGLSIADSPQQPVVVSFTMTPSSIDISQQNNTVTFDLVVSNPTGIASAQTRVTLANNSGVSLSATLLRTDSPINYSLAQVTFHGVLVIPTTVPAGIYSASANPVTGLNADGSNGYSTPTLLATTTSSVVGAPNYLLVRAAGFLNFSYPTFNGPAFNNLLGNSFVDPKFTSVAAPIWKVGEIINIKDYYELKVPTLTLKVTSATPATCSAGSNTLTLISVGICSFTVYTDQTADYQLYKDIQVVTITTARVKPTYSLGVIPTQSSTALPLKVPGPLVYGPIGYISPISLTPSVCYGAGSYITVISGGTCTLNYSSPATLTNLASDVYTLSFEISRTPQIISFTTPSSASLGSRSLILSATSSSGLPVSFQSDSPSICSVTGSSLNFVKSGNCEVKALQSGSTTIAPTSLTQTVLVTGTQVIQKKIVCVKAGKSKIFVGTKCPTGYKVKK